MLAEERKRKVINRIVEDVRSAYWRAVSAERLLGKIARAGEGHAGGAGAGRAAAAQRRKRTARGPELPARAARHPARCANARARAQRGQAAARGADEPAARRRSSRWCCPRARHLAGDPHAERRHAAHGHREPARAARGRLPAAQQRPRRHGGPAAHAAEPARVPRRRLERQQLPLQQQLDRLGRARQLERAERVPPAQGARPHRRADRPARPARAGPHDGGGHAAAGEPRALRVPPARARHRGALPRGADADRAAVRRRASRPRS